MNKLKIPITLLTTLAFTKTVLAAEPNPGWAAGEAAAATCRVLSEDACLTCCETMCRAAAAGQAHPNFEVACWWACVEQCPYDDDDDDDNGPMQPAPVPSGGQTVNGTEASPALAFLTAAAVAGAVIIRFIRGGGGGGGSTSPVPSYATTASAVIIGLPILLGGVAGDAFADYVDNYNTGVDNSVFGSGPTGTGQCPPGEEPITYMYGTACVPSSNPPPPPPSACSTVRTCEEVQAEEGGFIIAPEDGALACPDPYGGPYLSPAAIACVENGILTSRPGCLELRCARVDYGDP